MSKQYALKAEKRDRAGKGVARSLRREGRIPGVVYGDGKAPEQVSLVAADVQREWLKGQMFTHLCDLDVSGAKNLVLVRDVQVHPVNDRAVHIDFLRVSPKTTLHVFVPVRFINQETCIGLKNSGALNIVSHDVELICRATEIPEYIEVDIAAFDIGDPIKISHAKLPAGAVPALKGEDFTLGSITPPKQVEVITPTATAAVAAEGAAAPAAGAAAPAAGAKPDAKAPAAAKAPAGKDTKGK